MTAAPDALAAAQRELELLTRTGRIDWQRPVRDALSQAGFQDRWPSAEWAGIAWYGPLSLYGHDPEVSDLLLNGPGRALVIVQRGTRLDTGIAPHRSWIEFAQRQLLARAGLVAPGAPWPRPGLIGTADRRWRFAVTQPPLTPDGPSVAVRLLPQRWRTLDDLIAQGLLPRPAAELLLAAVRHGVTVLIAGSTGSGKTTLTAALLLAVAEDKRVVVIEEARELPPLPDSVALEVGNGALGFSEAVRFSLRQKPDLIVVGECRGPEALAMLQAAASGHPGIGTIHAPDVQAALKNLERMACEAPDAHPAIVRGLLTSSAVPLLVVQIGRGARGQRCVVAIEETMPMGSGGQAGERYPTNPLWSYDPGQDTLLRRFPVQGAWGRGQW